LAAACKRVELLPKFKGAEEELTRAVEEWASSAGDFTDALLVGAAKFADITDILSDDVDLVTFEGITVYTANRNSIDAADVAGKLLA
jgi:predicted nucleic acid-binding protein